MGIHTLVICGSNWRLHMAVQSKIDDIIIQRDTDHILFRPPPTLHPVVGIMWRNCALMYLKILVEVQHSYLIYFALI